MRVRRPAASPAPDASPAATRAAALALLSRRDFTVHELITRLVDRGYPRATVDDIARDLIAARALDDRRVAGAHVRTASRVKGRGALRIRRELEARGIAAAVVKDALTELAPDAEADALAAAVRRMRIPARLDPAARRRAFGRLLRRGFSAEAIGRVLRGRGDDNDEP